MAENNITPNLRIASLIRQALETGWDRVAGADKSNGICVTAAPECPLEKLGYDLAWWLNDDDVAPEVGELANTSDYLIGSLVTEFFQEVKGFGSFEALGRAAELYQ